MNDFLLCCDWGTSNLRLRLVQVEPFNVLAEVADSHGIAQVHRLWKEQVQGGNEAARLRESVYEKFLRQSVRRLQEVAGLSLDGLPIVISGMATSSLGLRELPYAELPFALSGEAAICDWIPRHSAFAHDLLLISGVKSAGDVMRGEETQLVGLATMEEARASDAVFIMPGTHSKHVRVKDGAVVGFATYMTGEIFQAVSEHTILRDSIRRTPNSAGGQVQAYRAGVQTAARGGLLRNLFSVRTRDLLLESSKEDNYHYLSGLLIGHEFRELAGDSCKTIVLACSETFLPAYKEAVACLGLTSRCRMLPPEIVDHAAPRGQLKFYQAVRDGLNAQQPV